MLRVLTLPCAFLLACGPASQPADTGVQPNSGPLAAVSAGSGANAAQSAEPSLHPRVNRLDDGTRTSKTISVAQVEEALAWANLHLVREDGNPDPHYYRVTYWYSENGELSILLYDGTIERASQKHNQLGQAAPAPDDDTWVNACSLGPRQYVCLEASGGPKAQWVTIAQRLSRMPNIGTAPLEAVQSIGFTIDRAASSFDTELSIERTLQHYVSASRGDETVGIAVLDFSEAAANAQDPVDGVTAIRTTQDKLLIVVGKTSSEGGISKLADKMVGFAPAGPN